MRWRFESVQLSNKFDNGQVLMSSQSHSFQPVCDNIFPYLPFHTKGSGKFSGRTFDPESCRVKVTFKSTFGCQKIFFEQLGHSRPLFFFISVFSNQMTLNNRNWLDSNCRSLCVGSNRFTNCATSNCPIKNLFTIDYKWLYV